MLESVKIQSLRKIGVISSRRHMHEFLNFQILKKATFAHQHTFPFKIFKNKKILIITSSVTIKLYMAIEFSMMDLG
jgi:hypothetical protein